VRLQERQKSSATIDRNGIGRAIKDNAQIDSSAANKKEASLLTNEQII